MSLSSTTVLFLLMSPSLEPALSAFLSAFCTESTIDEEAALEFSLFSVTTSFSCPKNLCTFRTSDDLCKVQQCSYFSILWRFSCIFVLPNSTKCFRYCIWQHDKGWSTLVSILVITAVWHTSLLTRILPPCTTGTSKHWVLRTAWSWQSSDVHNFNT